MILKHTDNQEYHVLDLRNELRGVKIELLQLPVNRTTDIVVKEITAVLGIYILTHCGKRIVADITSVNIGKRNALSFRCKDLLLERFQRTAI